MNINWLWDTRISEEEARKILRDEKHPKFNIYAEKLLSRVSDPKIVFEIIDKVIFCKKWSTIKNRMRKDRWLKDKIAFWDTIYERVKEQLREQGIKIRYPAKEKIPQKRLEIAQEFKRMRKILGISQKELASKLGVIQQYISKIETGRENLSIDTLDSIANLFGKELVIGFW